MDVSREEFDGPTMSLPRAAVKLIRTDDPDA
jgi:hypothetical protein